MAKVIGRVDQPEINYIFKNQYNIFKNQYNILYLF